MKKLFFILFLLSATFLKATPVPTTYFTDQAAVTSQPFTDKINHELADFERATSNQFLVIIFPSLPDGAERDQYSIQTFNDWKIGQKNKNNGVVLFIYYKEHKLFICTGRGLEGALPDATCRNIEDEYIVPRFRAHDFEGGIQAGVDAIISASKGEFKGTGQTVHETKPKNSISAGELVGIFAIVLILIIIFIICAIFVPKNEDDKEEEYPIDPLPFIAGAAAESIVESKRKSRKSSYTEPEYESPKSEPYKSRDDDDDNSSSSSSSDDSFSSGGGSSAGGGAGSSW